MDRKGAVEALRTLGHLGVRARARAEHVLAVVVCCRWRWNLWCCCGSLFVVSAVLGVVSVVSAVAVSTVVCARCVAVVADADADVQAVVSTTASVASLCLRVAV